MLPLYDENDCRRFPIVNTALIVVNILVFAYEIGCASSLESLFMHWGTISNNVMHHFDSHALTTLFSSMFLHAGFGHLIGNLWVLYLFGDNVEDRMGRFNYLMFYFFCGLMADASQILSNPSCTMPSIGASGAIAGILGAYLILFPEVRVKTWVTWYWCPMIPAWIIIGGWFTLQCISSAMPSDGVESIAWFAHIGGFVAGLTVLMLMREQDLVKIDSTDILTVPSSNNPNVQLKFVPKLSFGPVLAAVAVGVTAGFLLQPVVHQSHAAVAAVRTPAPRTVAISSGSPAKSAPVAVEKAHASRNHKHSGHKVKREQT